MLGKMRSKTLVILIIYVMFSLPVEGFPTNKTDELEPRDISDYVPSWFWSSKNTKEEHDVESEIVKEDHAYNFGDKSSPQNNVSGLQIVKHKINDNLDSEEIIPVQDIPVDVKPENVDKILEQLKQDIQSSNEEEKTKTLSLWKSLADTVSKTTSPYVEVFHKNARHIIDIGAFGSSKRSRCFTDTASPLSGILALILSLFGLGGGSSQILGLPAAISSSQSSANANANALALGAIANGIPASVQYVSLQDLARMKAAPPVVPGLGLGTGAQLISGGDLLKLGGGSQPNPAGGDANSALLTALILRLLNNGPARSRGGSTEIDGIDLSKLRLPEGEDNSTLLNIIRQIKNPPDTKDGSNNSRVVIVRGGDSGDPELDPVGNDFQIFNIRGTPEERFRRINRKFKKNPDTREKIIIVNELDRLKNDPNIDPDLKELIRSLDLKIRADPSYGDILEIEQLTNGRRKPSRFKNVEFIDGSGGGFSRSSEDDDELLNELVRKLTSKYKTRNIRDPKTLEDVLKSLNLKTLEEW